MEREGMGGERDSNSTEKEREREQLWGGGQPDLQTEVSSWKKQRHNLLLLYI